MTIITVEGDTAGQEMAKQLIHYEQTLAVLHLAVRCIGGDKYRIHLVIPTSDDNEHQFAIDIAKDIFQLAVLI